LETHVDAEATRFNKVLTPERAVGGYGRAL
jgi:hypothetical protein